MLPIGPIPFESDDKLTARRSAVFRRLVQHNLCFSDRDDELAFKKRCEPQLRRSVSFGVCIYLGICATKIPGWVREAERSENPFRWASGDPRTLMFCSWIFCACLLIGFGSALILRARVGWFQTVNWELAVVLLIMLVMAILPLQSDWHAAMICGISPDEIYVYDSRGAELSMALIMDTYLTMVCVFCPVRVCALWAAVLTCAGVFVSVILIVGSPWPHMILQNVVLLIFLCIISFVGAWMQEQHRREKWLALRQVQESQKIMEAQDVQLQGSSALAHGLRSVAQALCDIVLTLSGDLCLCDPDLGARMALFGPTPFGSSEKSDQPFTDVLEPADQKRFERLLEQVSDSCVPQCMPATLQLCSSRVEAHLMVVGVAAAGQARYLVGVRYDPGLGTGGELQREITPPALRSVSETHLDDKFEVSVLTREPSLQRQRTSSPSYVPQNMRSEAIWESQRSNIVWESKRSEAAQCVADDNCETVSFTFTQSTTCSRRIPSPRLRSSPVAILVHTASQTDDELPCRVPSFSDLEPMMPQASGRRQSWSSQPQAGDRRDSCDSLPGGCHIPLMGQFSITPLSTVLFVLTECASSMNCATSASDCCSWHAAMKLLTTALAELSASPCNESWLPKDGWQCPECCGLNPLPIHDCDVCAYGPPQTKKSRRRSEGRSRRSRQASPAGLPRLPTQGWAEQEPDSA